MRLPTDSCSIRFKCVSDQPSFANFLSVHTSFDTKFHSLVVHFSSCDRLLFITTHTHSISFWRPLDTPCAPFHMFLQALHGALPITIYNFPLHCVSIYMHVCKCIDSVCFNSLSTWLSLRALCANFLSPPHPLL